MRKIFDKSNSMANEKDNAEFFIRYAKAREEYMIKKFKKLSMKDDSYDSTLLSLASRFNNKQYKIGFNDFYDTRYQKNNKKINLSMNDYIPRLNRGIFFFLLLANFIFFASVYKR